MMESEVYNSRWVGGGNVDNSGGGWVGGWVVVVMWVVVG